MKPRTLLCVTALLLWRASPVLAQSSITPIASPPAAATVAPTATASTVTDAAPAAATATLSVPGGTPVKIGLTNSLASNTAHAGDKFQFKAIEDVAIDGWIVVAKDALGEGQVIAAEGAGGNGHPGKIQLQFDWVYASDGMKLKLSDVPNSSNGDAAKGAASTAAVASYVLLGPLGLFAHNFVHGKDVTVKTDQKIQVYIASNVHITPKTKVSSSDGFAH